MVNDSLFCTTYKYYVYDAEQTIAFHLQEVYF